MFFTLNNYKKTFFAVDIALTESSIYIVDIINEKQFCPYLYDAEIFVINLMELTSALQSRRRFFFASVETVERAVVCCVTFV